MIVNTVYGYPSWRPSITYVPWLAKPVQRKPGKQCKTKR